MQESQEQENYKKISSHSYYYKSQPKEENKEIVNIQPPQPHL